MIGQTVIANGNEYKIIKLLAKGKGGYNYLAKSGDTAVVVKQIHYEPYAMPCDRILEFVEAWTVNNA